MASEKFVLRSVYLEPEVDDFLRNQAFTRKISKNEVIREYIRKGLKASVEEKRTGVSAKESAKATNV